MISPIISHGNEAADLDTLITAWYGVDGHIQVASFQEAALNPPSHKSKMHPRRLTTIVLNFLATVHLEGSGGPLNAQSQA